MLRSLMSGVTGVKAHQTLLDVTGNNIANVNTAGFKKSKVTFQDLIYQTNRQGSAPSDGELGGIDSQQVGLGVKVGAIETLHTQGNTEYTGNRTDLAIQGDGYYVVTDGGDPATHVGALYARKHEGRTRPSPVVGVVSAAGHRRGRVGTHRA